MGRNMDIHKCRTLEHGMAVLNMPSADRLCVFLTSLLSCNMPERIKQVETQFQQAGMHSHCISV